MREIEQNALKMKTLQALRRAKETGDTILILLLQEITDLLDLSIKKDGPDRTGTVQKKHIQ